MDRQTPSPEQNFLSLQGNSNFYEYNETEVINLNLNNNLNHEIDWTNQSLIINTSNFENHMFSSSNSVPMANDSLYPELPFDSAKLDLAREEDHIRESVKNSKLDCLSKVKNSISSARKHKMRVVEHYLCDSCDKLIEKPDQGFVIQGNIYVADPRIKGGLIGDNFPEEDAEGKVDFKAIKQSVLCKDCFCRVLGLGPKSSNKGAINFSIKQDYFGTRY